MRVTSLKSRFQTWKEKIKEVLFLKPVSPLNSIEQSPVSSPMDHLISFEPTYCKDNMPFEPCELAHLIGSLAQKDLAVVIIDLSDISKCKHCCENQNPCENLSEALILLSYTRAFVHFV